MDEDQIVEIEAPKIKKHKHKKPKTEQKQKKREGKRVIFDLNQNKTKEFFMHSKVGLEDLPKSKE